MKIVSECIGKKSLSNIVQEPLRPNMSVICPLNRGITGILQPFCSIVGYMQPQEDGF